MVHLHAHRAIPVWLERASEKALRGFLLLWGVSLLVPYAIQYVSPGGVWGTCAWNEFGGRTTAWLSPLLIAAGYAITYVGFSRTAARPDITERELEFFFLYCSPQVVMMTLGLFIALQRIRISGPRVKK